MSRTPNQSPAQKLAVPTPAWLKAHLQNGEVENPTVKRYFEGLVAFRFRDRLWLGDLSRRSFYGQGPSLYAWETAEPSTYPLPKELKKSLRLRGTVDDMLFFEEETGSNFWSFEVERGWTEYDTLPELSSLAASSDEERFPSTAVGGVTSLSVPPEFPYLPTLPGESTGLTRSGGKESCLVAVHLDSRYCSAFFWEKNSFPKILSQAKLPSTFAPSGAHEEVEFGYLPGKGLKLQGLLVKGGGQGQSVVTRLLVSHNEKIVPVCFNRLQPRRPLSRRFEDTFECTAILPHLPLKLEEVKGRYVWEHETLDHHSYGYSTVSLKFSWNPHTGKAELTQHEYSDSGY